MCAWMNEKNPENAQPLLSCNRYRQMHSTPEADCEKGALNSNFAEPDKQLVLGGIKDSA